MRIELLYAFMSSLFSWTHHLPSLKALKHFIKKSLPSLVSHANIKYAIKTACSVVLSYLLAILIAPEFAFWAPISAIIVMQVNVAASLESSIDRIVGCLYGAFMGLILYFIMPANILFHSVGLFIIAIVCALLLIWNPRYRLAGITSISIFIASSMRENNIWIFAGSFMLMIMISILVSVVVSVVIWPVSGAEDLRQAIRKQYLMASDYLETITNTFLEGQSHLLPTYIDELHDAISRNRPALRRIKEYEGMNLARHYPDLDLLVTGLEQIRIYITSLLDALDSECEVVDELPMTNELMALASTSASGLRWIASHKQNQPLPDVRRNIEASSIRLADLRESNIFRQYSHGKVIQIFSFYNAMSHLAETVANLEEQIDILASHELKHKKRQSHKVKEINCKL